VPDLDAYATDCRLFGRAEVGSGRLTDFLNATEELDIEAVRLESLDDGHLVDAGDVTVTTDELCAIVATETRGEPSRRLHTHTTKVEVDVGPYVVIGMVHGTAASDPMTAALRRAAWLPLTEASITYRRGADDVTDTVETIIVNRALATLFKVVEDDAFKLPWESDSPKIPSVGSGVDLTAWIGYEDFPHSS
jgi:hypothetical protein